MFISSRAWGMLPSTSSDFMEGSKPNSALKTPSSPCWKANGPPPGRPASAAAADGAVVRAAVARAPHTEEGGVAAAATLAVAACGGSPDSSGGSTSTDVGKGALQGAGATFPYPIYAKWADAYKKETGNGLNYQSIGSGGGIKQIIAKTVDFGASDAPLEPAMLEKEGLVQFPMVMGGVVPVFKLDGIKPGGLRLTGTVLADIYLGKVTKWNDPAIAALNKGTRLPDQAISVVARSDGSGTTFLFTNYLSKVSPTWKNTVSEGTAVKWPSGVGGKAETSGLRTHRWRRSRAR